MWQKLLFFEREELLPKAIDFTGNALLYGEWMLKALELWPFSCEHNLSDKSQNRQAWIGHAACYLAIQCTEDVTREAWWKLTDEQRDLANAQADIAIAEFEKRYASKS